MCGRMNISDSEGVMILIDALDAAAPEQPFKPRFNVAPSMQISCVVAEGNDTATPSHVSRSYEWGMIPPWAKPGTFKSPLINARSETIREKPSFRSAIKKGRVVVPVNGFYEWKRQGKTRQAWFITGADSGPLALAGISSVSSEGVPQLCVVTTAANARMEQIHNRMPVILDIDGAGRWLDEDNAEVIDALMIPAGEDAIETFMVGDYVNNARNEGPKCIEPV